MKKDTLTVEKQTLEGTKFDFDGYGSIEISLLGTYQIENAVNVLNAIEVLKNQGVSISNQSVKDGLKNAKWSARFEMILKSPTVIFDGGHNPQGVCEAVRSVKKYFGDKRLNVVTGVMADKDYSFIAEKISTVASKVFCISPNNTRALNAEEYAQVFKGLGIEAESFKTVSEAVLSAISDAKFNKKSVICLGSLYMYTDVINAINVEELDK